MRGTKSTLIASNPNSPLSYIKVAFVQTESPSDIPVYFNTNYTGFVIKATLRMG